MQRFAKLVMHLCCGESLTLIQIQTVNQALECCLCAFKLPYFYLLTTSYRCTKLNLKNCFLFRILILLETKYLRKEETDDEKQ